MARTKQAQRENPIANLDLRICYYNAARDDNGKLWLSCHRPALPGRLICHKHAPQVKARRRRRALRKAGR